MIHHTRRAFLTIMLLGTIILTGCGTTDPLSNSASHSDNTIVIGSQDYYSNEIIAEIYAQALEAHGHKVDRQFRIGQREAYLPEIEAGTIDLFPEYTGPLLQYWKADTTARLTDDVYTELQQAVPNGLRVLNQSPATDQNSYAVTQKFADEWHLKTIGDLTNVTTPITLGANSEGQNRPYGQAGLANTYGVNVNFAPIEDGGGPLTVDALNRNDIQLAIMYTANPSLTKNNLVTLDDPKGLFVASHVVPLASNDVNEAAADIINKISAAMTPEELLALNARSVDEGLPASTIAKDWLAKQKLS